MQLQDQVCNYATSILGFNCLITLACSHFIHSFIHQYFLNAYYVPDAAPGAGNAADEVPLFLKPIF